MPKASDGSAAAACDVERQFAVNDFNGVSYLASNHPSGEGFLRAEHITQSQNAGPWFLNEALRHAAGTVSIDSADKVFVHDYCFFTWFMAYIHTYPDVHAWPLDEYPGGELVTLYHSLLEHPRWRKSNGEDFVFFMPHASVGGGPAGETYRQLICEAFSAATFVVIERMQRFSCADFRQEKVVVAPYSANSKYQHCPVARVRKDKLIFYKGRCNPPEEFGSEGIALRYEVLAALPGSVDNTIACSDDKDPTSFVPQSHSALLETMASHQFCLVIAGDTQSSRRLTDAMLAECLPVFVGPPFHSLPLAHVVDYASFAVFLNVTSNAVFLTGELQGQPRDYMWNVDIARPRPTSPSQSEWWVPDVDLSTISTDVDDFHDILPALESLPDLAARQDSLKRFSPYFRYSSSYGAAPSATKAIVDLICDS